MISLYHVATISCTSDIPNHTHTGYVGCRQACASIESKTSSKCMLRFLRLITDTALYTSSAKCTRQLYLALLFVASLRQSLHGGTRGTGRDWVRGDPLNSRSENSCCRATGSPSPFAVLHISRYCHRSFIYFPYRLDFASVRVHSHSCQTSLAVLMMQMSYITKFSTRGMVEPPKGVFVSARETTDRGKL